MNEEATNVQNLPDGERREELLDQVAVPETPQQEKPKCGNCEIPNATMNVTKKIPGEPGTNNQHGKQIIFQYLVEVFNLHYPCDRKN